MEKRRLGKTDLEVTVLGFGGSEIGYHRVPQDSVDRLLNSALDAGLNVIDTAECYYGSEELIGRAVGKRRSEFYLLTKCGHPHGMESAANWSRFQFCKASSAVCAGCKPKLSILSSYTVVQSPSCGTAKRLLHCK